MLDVTWIVSYVCLGITVGFLAGLLGIGGGGIMVPVLTTLFLMQGIAVENAVHLALGTSMASIIMTSLSSLRAHHSNGAVRWELVKRLSLGIIPGAWAATYVAASINSMYLAMIFSAFMTYVAYKVFSNTAPKSGGVLLGRQGMFGAGFGIGGISSLVSIGGGALTVPFLLWQNVNVKKAIGTSAAIGFPISVAGTLGFIINGTATEFKYDMAVGFVYLPAVLIISIASFFMAPVGAGLMHRMPVKTIKKILGVLLLALSINMLYSVFSSSV